MLSIKHNPDRAKARILIIIMVTRREPVRVGMPTQFSRVDNRAYLRSETCKLKYM